MKIRANHLKIIGTLRRNGRAGFSEIAREHGLPITTVYDNYVKLARGGVVRKHSSIIDYKQLGFNYRSFIFLKSGRRDELLSFLEAHPSVNSIMKINDYDFMVDVIFPGMKEFYAFLDVLDDYGLSAIEHHDVVAPVKTEEMPIASRA
ncbi:hypothetical protein JW826_04755 [Candidatus Woesearchaeota archaeon]|nr:hypothetical protein [Candidatus Woesearchaeota archaeon]